MNHLFTYKAKVILFSLLACYFTSKAQASKDTTASAKSPKVDTTLSKQSAGSQLLKTDTTLVIKAGATLVHKADTTMVIDPDGSIAKKYNDMVAAKEKADQAKNGTKVDSALIKPAGTTQQQSNNVVNTVAPPAVNPASATVTTTPAATVIATPVPTSDASLPASQQSTGTNTQPTTGTSPQQSTGTNTQPTTGTSTQQTTGTSTQQQAGTQQPAVTQPQGTQQQTVTPVVKKDSVTQQATNSSNQSPTQQVGNSIDPSSKKVDSALVAKTDTSAIKKTDTIPAKKSDTTMVKKTDTAMMVSDTTVHQVKAQNGYIEVGGAGLAISANYDTRFHDERNGWGYRVGIGFFSSGGNTVETVPFQVNYLIGEHALMLELGAGTTFLNSTGTNIGNSKWEFDKITGFIATATIGFRYQPEHKGLNFRIGFVPILYDEGIIPAGGVSIGYTFK